MSDKEKLNEENLEQVSGGQSIPIRPPVIELPCPVCRQTMHILGTKRGELGQTIGIFRCDNCKKNYDMIVR